MARHFTDASVGRKLTLFCRVGPNGQVAHEGEEIYRDPRAQDQTYRRQLMAHRPTLWDREGWYRSGMNATTDREHHVVSAAPLDFPNVTVHMSLHAALNRLAARKEVIVAGTPEFLKRLVPSAHRVILLEFDQDQPADEHFYTYSDLIQKGFSQITPSVVRRGFVARVLTRVRAF